MQNTTKDFGSTIENQKSKFQITLDVQHFKPNELSVKVVNKEVVIEGKHEERLDEHGAISRQFTRRYFLPNDCDPDDVTSTLSSDGVLNIVANKKSIKDALNERSVPIKFCESYAKQEIDSSELTAAECAKKTSTEAKKDTKGEAKNKNRSVILKEEHISLLKPELLLESSCAKDIIREAKRETDEMFKISDDKVGQSVSSTTSSSEKIMEMSMDKIGSSSIAAASLTEFEMSCEKGKSSIASALSEFDLASEMMGKASMTTSSEMSSFQSSETSKMEESSSSFISSMTSSVKATSEKTNELFSDTVSAALKEAAENM